MTESIDETEDNNLRISECAEASLKKIEEMIISTTKLNKELLLLSIFMPTLKINVKDHI